MIQWIALATAVDAENRAMNAQKTADEANHKVGSTPQMVIIRPVDLVTTVACETKGFWDSFFCPLKKVLAKKPWATLSVKKSDIVSLLEQTDEDGQKYVYMRISEYAEIYRHSAPVIGLYIPGSIEQVVGVLNDE